MATNAAATPPISRVREPLLARSSSAEPPASALHTTLRELFEKRGALFFPEIKRSVSTYPQEVLGALWDLVWAGEITNDTLEPLRTLRTAGAREERRGRPRLEEVRHL